MRDEDFEIEGTLQALYAGIALELDGRWTGRVGGLQLSSHFQPVFSFPHGRPVGHEALIRASDAQGRPVSPLALFAQATDFAEQLRLDRLCRLLHVHNYCAQDRDGEGWLFLNIHPAVFIESAQQSRLLRRAAELLQELGMPMQRLVLEVTEDAMAQDRDFEQAVAWVRELGCLIALDDFGAGHSNFDRVWRIRPDIVKLDRSLLQRARQSPRVARMLAQMVALLHEGGALTLLEGVESLDEAELALDADVDLVQGYAFGHPQAQLQPSGQDSAEIAAIWSRFDARLETARAQHAAWLAPYEAAMQGLARQWQGGEDLRAAAAPLLALPATRLVFRLDAQGCALGEALGTPASLADPRFTPLERAGAGRWARRPYFRRALRAPGVLQMTRPYLSLQGAGLCLTLSIALPGPQGLEVLCADIEAGER